MTPNLRPIARDEEPMTLIALIADWLLIMGTNGLIVLSIGYLLWRAAN
jgi:hypothetical protein